MSERTVVAWDGTEPARAALDWAIARVETLVPQCIDIEGPSALRGRDDVTRA